MVVNSRFSRRRATRMRACYSRLGTTTVIVETTIVASLTALLVVFLWSGMMVVDGGTDFDSNSEGLQLRSFLVAHDCRLGSDLVRDRSCQLLLAGLCQVRYFDVSQREFDSQYSRRRAVSSCCRS